MDNYITEWCPHCEYEIDMRWDVKQMGYQAFCPVCGKRLMLCSECSNDNGGQCDYDSKRDCCRMQKRKQGEKPFQIWQLRQGADNAKYLFMHHSYLQKHGIAVELKRYDRVFSGMIAQKTTPEDVFCIFNRYSLPEGYTGHSLSVSDLIVMDGRVWYVDSFGFKDVTEEIGGVPVDQSGTKPEPPV